MDEGKAFSETFIPKEVDPVKEEERTTKIPYKSTDDNFCYKLCERYNKMMEIFPYAESEELQKMFLTLVLSEYEK